MPTDRRVTLGLTRLDPGYASAGEIVQIQLAASIRGTNANRGFGKN